MRLVEHTQLPDKATAKLAALNYYQLLILAPKATAGSYGTAAFQRESPSSMVGGNARPATSPRLDTEPGYNMHSPGEIGIDAFQANRSPTHVYRTAP